jgi:hypothetical protein
MGRPSNNRYIDGVCKEWGRTRRQLAGFDDPLLAKEYIGAMRSTLGQRRDLHACSKSNKLDIHWPEVYVGKARLVNAAHKALSPYLQFVMDLQYAAHVDPSIKADLLNINVRTYWRQVADVRQFVDGFLAAIEAAQATYE